MRRLLSSLVLMVLTAAAPGATVLIPIEFRELVRVSSTIVHGRITDVRSEWADGRRAVETFVTVDVTEYMKGSLGGTLTVRVPGGQIGRYRTMTVGAPAFREGDEVVLFLRSYNGVLSIVGLSQGAFRVVADSAGRRLVTTPVVMGKPGDAAEPVVRGDVARRPIAIDAFRDLVRRVVTETGAE
jgi:hypothetical protein